MSLLSNIHVASCFSLILWPTGCRSKMEGFKCRGSCSTSQLDLLLPCSGKHFILKPLLHSKSPFVAHFRFEAPLGQIVHPEEVSGVLTWGGTGRCSILNGCGALTLYRTVQAGGGAWRFSSMVEHLLALEHSRASARSWGQCSALGRGVGVGGRQCAW